MPIKPSPQLPFDPKAFLAKAGRGRTIAKYRRDETIFSQGDAADSVFYILRGKVKVSVFSELGKEAVVAIHGKDEFFGEICLSGQKSWISTTTAMTDCEIMRFEKKAFIQILADELAFSRLFVAHLLTSSIRAQEALIDQLFNSSEKRLARTLLILANYGEEGAPEPILAKVTHETLAKMIGTTRSRVSFFMNKFRKLGLISYNGKLHVHKSLLNLVLHDQPHIEA
jgi:CRP-like cAMP-binding protein